MSIHLKRSAEIISKQLRDVNEHRNVLSLKQKLDEKPETFELYNILQI